MGMYLSRELEVLSKNNQYAHPYYTRIDYLTATATIPTVVTSDNRSDSFTEITMSKVNARHLVDLYDFNDEDEHKKVYVKRNQLIAQLAAHNRVAIEEHGLNITVSFFKKELEGGEYEKDGETETLSPSPLIDGSKTIPGGIKSTENEGGIVSVEMSPFVTYLIDATVPENLKDTYSNKDIKLRFAKIGKKENDHKIISTTPTHTTIEPLYDTNTRHQIIGVENKNDSDVNKQPTSRIFPGNYETIQIGKKRRDTHYITLGSFPVQQYCYADSTTHAAMAGISIKTAEKQTASLKCETDAQAHGQAGRYGSTYGCIVRVDPAITGLSPSITDHFVHLLQEKASIDVSCFHPDLINILMFQRGDFINFLSRRHDKLKLIGKKSKVISTIPSAGGGAVTVEETHTSTLTQRQPVPSRLELEKALQEEKAKNANLKKYTNELEEKLMVATTQIEKFTEHIKIFQTLVTPP